MTQKQLECLCRDQTTVLYSVVRIFFEIIPQNPPLGFRPIHIYYRSSGPITNSTTDTNCYCIGLSSVDRYYCQMVYQFAHEFCHIYADPRISNWFIESICEMMSQYVLERLSEAWAVDPPFPNWGSYAPEFKKYLNGHLRETHLRTTRKDTKEKQALLDWLKENVSDLRQDPVKRDRNTIIAEIIRPIFELNQGSWEIITLLGRASSPYPEKLTDLELNSKFCFDRLEEIAPENSKEFVRKLHSILSL